MGSQAPQQAQKAAQLSQLSVNPRPPPSRSGSKWNKEEESWLVVNAMRDVETKWLIENFPGKTRSAAAITGHLSEMRYRNKLSRRWQNKSWSKEAPFTIEEDTEIIRWHIWGRWHIDTEVFVANSRVGAQVAERANYLAQDTSLIRQVVQAERLAQEALEKYDEVMCDIEFPPDSEDGRPEVSQSRLIRLSFELWKAEEESAQMIQAALSSVGPRADQPFRPWNEELGKRA
ncbi:hypothetical protein FQN57_006894 [Myotisia sp. PD_48]|nr:hypothetical protein FQN57_006894 [Myotisia sp. PD_48]